MYCLECEKLLMIEGLFCEHKILLNEDFKNRIKHSIRVLHFDYLWGACREVGETIKRIEVLNLFESIMRVYTRKSREHQANFLLLQCFENALRSTMAVTIANRYNKNVDDWFLHPNPQEKTQIQLIKKIRDIHTLRKKSSHIKQIKELHELCTFEVFDMFSMGDLEKILEQNYIVFSHIFETSKSYKAQALPEFGTKGHLIGKIKQIRCARNEVFHNKPTKIKF